jgi:phospholipase C
MHLPSRVLVATAALCLLAAGLAVNSSGCGGGDTTPAPPRSPLPPPSPLGQTFQHVVVIFQENRTPDNLFHALPNADIANSGMNSLGQTITLQPITLANNYDLSHAHTAFVKMYDGGKMDGADLVGVGCASGATGCPPPNPQFMYVNPSEVAPYFQMAQKYTFSDRMFQTNQGPSFPAHQFIISGTSAPTATSDLFASENPHLPVAGSVVGCTAPQGEFVLLIDPTGAESSSKYPCFEHPTLVDELDAKSITWKYYTPTPGSIWTGPNAIQHLRMGPDWTNNVITPSTQILTDITNGQLPQVSWVIPTAAASDHALSNDGSGPSWVASIVNAIGSSPYWSSTAIIITWDDWGGWYDHVPPKITNSYEYGFRVPLIVVSPFAKPGYVSHVTHDFGSILKFIEEVFQVPTLGYADTPADDLSDCFDLAQPPIAFQTVAAPLDAAFFLNDKRPPQGPDNDDL